MSGVSRDPCSSSYLGPFPFSEPETQNLRDLFNSIKPTPVLALSIHSALGSLLHGWAYKKDTFPDNIDEIVK